MVARIAENGRLHVGHAILYLKIRVPECPFNEPLHCKCNLFLRHVQVIINQYLQIVLNFKCVALDISAGNFLNDA